MPAATRLGDMSTGHQEGECFWPPRPVISGSSNVFINGIAAITIGSEWQTHCVTGDTLVLVDGVGVRIDSLINNFDGKQVKSRLPDGNILPNNILLVFQSGTTNNLVEIQLENGKSLQCTPEHLIQLKNGSYKMACELTQEDEL